MTPSKKTLSLAVAGLASLTWIGVSAASEHDEPVLDEQVEVIEDDTTTTVETETEIETEDPADEGAPEAADSPAEHPENHGRYVSEAAHTCPEGPGHGGCVRVVAQSDEGKSAPAAETTGDETLEPEASPDGEEDADLEDDAEGAPAEHGRGASSGPSAGKGHGKG